MDRIFSEIKKAIEEEMRNAESGPTPGGGRPQGGGGRRAQEYAEWLKEEQDRLRGSGSEQAQPQPLQEMQVEAPPQSPAREQRKRQQSQQSRERAQQQQREAREHRDSEQRRSAEQRERRQAQSSTQHSRSQAAHERRTSDAYSTRQYGSAGLGRQIQRSLRSPNGLRQAFLVREIVSKPVSLRDKDEHLIS